MKKALNVISKISLGVLIVSLLGLLVAKFVTVTATDPWDLFYAAVANLILTWTTVISVAAYVILNYKKVWAALKEGIRKLIVTLKRNPSVIPLIMMFVSFLVFSLNLTDVSDTTAKVQGKGMGLCQFAIMLFSLLCMVCMLNAFPRRKKPNIPMVVLMFVMFGILIFCDIHYLNGIAAALNRTESPIKLTESTAYIAKAFNMLATYQTMIIVTAVLVVLMPIYSRLLKKVKTSIDVEDNGAMGEIEIND